MCYQNALVINSIKTKTSVPKIRHKYAEKRNEICYDSNVYIIVTKNPECVIILGQSMYPNNLCSEYDCSGKEIC